MKLFKPLPWLNTILQRTSLKNISKMNSFLSEEELKQLGLKSYGSNVMISRKASFYGASNMTIGDNVRIDDFCILSGNLKIGSNVHISAYVALYGALGIELEDYTGISAQSIIYSAMDDFSGDYLVGPIHPEHTTHVTGGKVTVKRFVQIGCTCVVFPGVTINEGSVIGAMSLVNKDVPGWGIYVGTPVKFLKSRSNHMASLVK